MASEITYAEVKFKNARPAAVAEVPPETKKQEHHPQKYPPWLPWVISLLLFLVCLVLVALLEQGWICCPNGWKLFQKSCYYQSTDTMPWTESVQNCTGMGSQLVVINSKEEQAFLHNMLKQAARSINFYIGLHAEEVGQWQWLDQTPFNKTAAFWREKEPSNVEAEKCGVIHTMPEIHNWNDVRCEDHYRICEAAALTLTERPSS
ncbi:PREDICTED: C-type lectin domain family 4 member D-like isoform X2 [Calidris pugnax]|uniref:C-type lectin domain family 4 member D-like isoform X2 n=1 Tax=Calidris pugnax TaxID=198806 RepID=UPI00071CB7B7|nr:PREDICTED: C-type lectin domain family 4 member D-like isoform X2 [Calidris pugnax]